MPTSAGIVLAGGKSTRMGAPKAALEWHGSTLLRRTTGILARVTDGPVVVVRAAGQALPALRPDVEIVDDPLADLGPLQGIAAGLAAVGDRAAIAFVCSTDLPFLHPAFVRRVLAVLGAAADSASTGDDPSIDVGLPVARGFPQPLAAAYRTALAPQAARLVAERRLRPGFLFDECVVSRIDAAELRADPLIAAFDPDLDSVLNVNDPAGYSAARARPAPEVTVRRLGPLAADHRESVTVRAATVAHAAAAAGIVLGEHLATLNGDQVTGDGQTPLAAGDTVLFRSSA
jgi:molybdenum cofactor guanylyltransferase